MLAIIKTKVIITQVCVKGKVSVFFFFGCDAVTDNDDDMMIVMIMTVNGGMFLIIKFIFSL